ncbi:hypothetical protein SEA_COLUCCI_55 [Arthrobacter phage Colucci]|uniref:Uncharacterized protein n=1 Tax=Arthrobacter phage Colucci TaxID=2015834 RepID=A0A286N2W8_9CAUD|nr:hypothetical protein FDI27_gp055 [Arthrobacter phage Colucci]ASX98725.1 hypothetical protein SEA_COLUCCI_55 [Arthrobacter phage Colucci]
MSIREAYTCAGKIHDAIDDGTLKNVRVVEVRSNGSVEAWTNWDGLSGGTLEKDAEDVAEIANLFPGGRFQRMGLQHKGGKFSKPTDRARYINNRGPVIVIFNYYVAHECRDFTGRADFGGKPKWWCVSCKKPVTTTRAREIGLLPKLARKGTK